MPQKFQGENSKAQAKAVAGDRKKVGEALWQETDKHVLKKEHRKDIKEKMDLLERNKETHPLLDQENAKLKSKPLKDSGSGVKVTRAQIDEAIQNAQQPLELKAQRKPQDDVIVKVLDDTDFINLSNEESEEEYEPPIKKRIPQPEAWFRKFGAMHMPEMVDCSHAERCRNQGCKSKTYMRCISCRMFLCITKKRNCFLEYHR
ncbi:coiled-coil domain-containing protein 124-like isoform X1 [Nerophis lumbriciformis]|uniref:coiled-coil domain-containing protein 124-like isoform X1 n=1 Tax=Nerophis lumbriciformis TaxID=546530 RepID=UPI002ADF1A47|nr:coiled-coil domain-containing protein 124-like isoform X1 [Nerophis lumbriciformis]